MKYVILALLLAACANKKEDGPLPFVAPVPAAAVAAAHLAKSEELSEADAIAAARATAVDGGLPAAASQRCWEREALRPNVREACLLAWAAHGEPSEFLTQVLRKSLDGGPTSRAIRIASVRREDFVVSLKADDLLWLLSTLADEPAWIREQVVYTWLGANVPTVPEIQSIFTAMKPAGVEGDPYSVGLSLVISSKFGFPFAAQADLDAACPKNLTGVSTSRCLRILSSVTAFGKLPPQYSTLIPPANDGGVTLFKRSFPTRTSLL